MLSLRSSLRGSLKFFFGRSPPSAKRRFPFLRSNVLGCTLPGWIRPSISLRPHAPAPAPLQVLDAAPRRDFSSRCCADVGPKSARQAINVRSLRFIGLGRNYWRRFDTEKGESLPTPRFSNFGFQSLAADKRFLLSLGWAHETSSHERLADDFQLRKCLFLDADLESV
jgi:hypothetical protein